MDLSRKRKAEPNSGEAASKKSKGTKQWRVPKKEQSVPSSAVASLEPGDAGIWVTCDMHKEGKCTAELRDLFNEYAERLYANPEGKGIHVTQDGTEREDIEADIEGEIEGLKESGRKTLFQPVKIDVRCVTFFRTLAPVEPVSFVHRICSDALQGAAEQKTRWTRRLTPITTMGKATEKGLEEVTKEVLAPHFHTEGVAPKKFAIRTTIRNHAVLSRDVVIKQVADAVGSPHTVDLGKYDLLILVEIYKNMCGMSVVGSDFDQLKRYNVAEIYDLSAKESKAKDSVPALE